MPCSPGAFVQVDGFELEYVVRGGVVRALDGVDLTFRRGETIGVVGESGSGKSSLGHAVLGLLPANARHCGGQVQVDGVSLMSAHPSVLRTMRRKTFGVISQNPMSALDPTRRVRAQFAREITPEKIRETLDAVGLHDYERIAKSYPHQLSGGMAQRVAIAVAIAHEPSIVLADEPTASLDSSTRGRILDLLFEIAHEFSASLVLMSHDLTSVLRRCETIAVMYAGRVVEVGSAATIADDPRHPYTQALLRASLANETSHRVVMSIPGIAPVLHGASTHCAFADRCKIVASICRDSRPTDRLLDGRRVVCHRAEITGGVQEVRSN